MRAMIILAAAVLALAPGCPGDPKDPNDGSIGSGCGGDGDCNEGLKCITDAPGGLCTRECSADCPGEDVENICSAVETPAGILRLCAPICHDPDECRDGYTCISVGRQSVCGL